MEKQQITFYKENGYLIIQDIVSSKILDRYLENIRLIANKDFAAIMNPDRYEFLIAQCYELIEKNWSLQKKINFLNLCNKISKRTLELMRNNNIVSILESIQGIELVGLMSQMLFKEANSNYSTQAWDPHQDNSYPRNLNGLYLTTNLFLSDADKKNGSLYVFPKSHNNGLIDSKLRPSYREKRGSNPGNKISKDILFKYKKIDLNFNKGDLLILHGNLIHGSYPNYSNKSRPLLSCSYINVGEKFIPGKNAQRKVINLK